MLLRKTLSVHSVERALAILEYLNQPRRSCSISQLSRSLNIPKSTAHMLILTLSRHGYVVRAEGGRSYTARVRFYGAPQLRIGSVYFEELALPQMHRLMRRTGLTVHLVVGEHGQVTYLQKVSPATESLDTFVGKRANLHSTAGGKVILAYQDEQPSRAFLAKDRFTRHTPNTISTVAELRAEIRSVRRNGFAVDDEEEELGTCCLAVPVFGPDGQFVAALELGGAKSQIHDAGLPRLAALAKDAARQLQAAWVAAAGARAPQQWRTEPGAPSCVAAAVA